MWILLATVIVCLTIIVMFRMYIDMRRIDHQHTRIMRSDQRDFERYIEVTSRPAPKAALPDFEAARRATQHQYRQPPAISAMSDAELEWQLEALKRTYAQNDYDRFIARQREGR